MSLMMSISGLAGESGTAGHADWFTIEGFNWGGRRSVRTVTGGGYNVMTTFAAPQLRDVVISREADAITALLWYQVLPQDRLTVKVRWLRPGPGGEPVHYLEVVLGNARLVGISDVSLGGRPIETLTFTYESVEFVGVPIGNSLTGTQQVVAYELPAATGR